MEALPPAPAAAEVDDSGAPDDEDGLADGVRLSSLKGGNPKVVYINYDGGAARLVRFNDQRGSRRVQK